MKKFIYALVFISANLVYSQQSSNQKSIDASKIIGVWKEVLPESRLKSIAQSGLKISENFATFWKYEENGLVTVKMPVPKFSMETKKLESDGFQTNSGLWKIIDNKMVLTLKKNKKTETAEFEILCLDDENLILKAFLEIMNDYQVNNYVRVKGGN